MPSARARRRGAALNWRFAVYGIQNADFLRSAAAKSARLFMRLAYAYAEYETTFCLCWPRPAIFSVITSPGLRNTGLGLTPRPTPGGVPVQMMSPGSNVMYWLTCEMILAQPKIMVRVL